MKQAINHKMGLVLCIICLILSFEVKAQDPGNDPDIPSVPLDGGIGLLIGAGAIYAGKKLNQWKNPGRKNRI